MFIGCSGYLNEQDQKLASVNGYTITVGAFERSYVQTLIQTGQNDTPKARYTQLNLLIEEHLWYEEALRRNLDMDSSLIRHRELALRQAIGGRYYELEFVEKLPPLNDVEIRQAFARYKQPIVVRHLFYRAESEVRKAHERLKSGHSFLDEAQRSFQTATFDSTAGWLGEIRYFQVDDAFADVAFALSTGSYSDPVRSRQGWHIIKVEDRIESPIITESEYQTRKSGISGLLRIRRRRLEGDRFVRTFMEGRDVQVIPEGVRSLSVALKRLTNTSLALDHSSDTSPLPLIPETPLATFRMNGTIQAFTAEDYFFWFPVLPFSEAISNPAASIGRAIRNEAFALTGMNLGLENDKIVQEDVTSSTRTYLANSMRQLRPDTTLLDALRSVASIHIDTTLFRQIMLD